VIQHKYRMTLIARVEATQITIDKWLDEEFNWGTADCGQMVGDHLENLGFETPLVKAGSYTTELGAQRAVRKTGAKSMEEIIDQMGFERIPPASAIVGDVVGFPGGSEEKPWTALGVHTGSDKILGFAAAPGEEAVVRTGPVSICTVAWRVS
jgi:hypothetical protein